ncbi:MAG: hypothetical protein ACI9HK_003595, partial [Pirellulaceae bacterium]
GRLHPTAFELRYHSISMAETREVRRDKDENSHLSFQTAGYLVVIA